MGVKSYEGIIRRGRHQRDPIVIKALDSYFNMRRRCYDKACPAFKYYGAKGISVEFSLREFVAWYIDETKSFKGESPTVGRIDHSKNYSFDNMEIQSRSENSKERIRRLGTPHPNRPVEIINLSTGELLISYGYKYAAKVVGVSNSTVQRHLKGDSKRFNCGFTFRYAGGVQ